MPEPGPFRLETETLGALPLVNHFWERLRLDWLLFRYFPYAENVRALLPTAQMLGLLIRNLILHREPVYALEEWASRFEPGLLGLAVEDVELLNDDRVGRALQRLFEADRASLLTELMLHTVAEFDIDLSQLHNDSTSITFSGVYATSGQSKGGKATARITFGRSKDHRPDLRQLIWILTVSADGAVPIAYRVADGNTIDDGTHISTWDALVRLVGRLDFLYVADCKLANREAMNHISTRGGRFLTVLPRTRAEDDWFRQWIQHHPPAWSEVARRPGRREGEPDDVWLTVPSPIPSGEGYRIVWVRSSAMASHDVSARQGRIEAGIGALEKLTARLGGPRSRLRTRATVEGAASTALATAGAERWVGFTLGEITEESFHQERRGRPGDRMRYRRSTRTRFQLAWFVRQDVVAADAASDGCFPLITNDTDLSEAELLAAYKYQPNLEKRHAQLKGVQLVTPVFLKDPARVEGLLCCYFISLLMHALIERQIRLAMTAEQIKELALYPEARACRAPTAARILEIFADVDRHRLYDGDQLVQVFEPSLTPIQVQVLELLGVSPAVYTSTEGAP